MNLPLSLLFLRLGAVVLLAAVLPGCASLSADGGLDAVARLANERTGQALSYARPDAQAAETSAAIRAALEQTLTVDEAERIALLNNKSLLATLAGVGVAEADLVQAGRLANPGFHFSRLRGSEGEIERSVAFDIVGLLSMPSRRAIEERRFAAARLQAAAQAVALAAETRRAWYRAVAARQAAQFAQQAADAAAAAAELARRMRKAGNWSALDEARALAALAELQAQALRTRLHAVAAGEQLVRLLGVAIPEGELKLPERLPDMPPHSHEIAEAEQKAMRLRLDVQEARENAEALAASLGLTRATRFVNVLEAGYLNKSTGAAPRANGYEISLELPLFDFGEARTARAEALYTQALLHAAETGLRARSEVREAYAAYRTSWEIARVYRDELVPARKKAGDEMLLRYNGMLASVFDLLADAREQVQAANAAIEAQRDFWLAETDMHAALRGSGAAK